jgi:hypothetical protein
MRRSGLDAIHRVFLQAAHRLSEQGDANGVEPDGVLDALQMNEEQAESILDSLVNARLIVWPAKGHILLTAAGIELVEAARMDEPPTAGVPPLSGPVTGCPPASKVT